MKKVYIFGAVALIVLSGFIYIWYTEFRIPNETTHITVSPKWLHQAQFAGMYTAKDKGYYQKEGLDVSFEQFEAGDSLLQDLKSGRSEFVYMNASEFLEAASKGEDVFAIAAIYQISPYVIASLRDSNIKSPRQLEGKVIGIKGGRGAEADAIFSFLLSSAGLTSEDVDTKFISFETTEAEDLISGEADAVGLYRTRLFDFEQRGLIYDVINPEQYGFPVYNDVIVVTKEYAESNPGLVRSFLKATIRGWKYSFSNEDEAIEIVSKYVNNDIYRNRDLQAYIFNVSRPLIQPTLQSKIGIMEEIRWKKFYEVLVDRGFVDPGLNVTEIFTNEYLP